MTIGGLGGILAIEIWLTEPYYKEYRQRKGVSFHESEKTHLFQVTQELQRNWPQGMPPEIGAKFGIFYTKCDFPSGGILRVAFGCETTMDGTTRLIALTTRTKQELSQGSHSGTSGWYKHMSTVGLARWSDYRRGIISAWKIY